MMFTWLDFMPVDDFLGFTVTLTSTVSFSTAEALSAAELSSATTSSAEGFISTSASLLDPLSASSDDFASRELLDLRRDF